MKGNLLIIMQLWRIIIQTYGLYSAILLNRYILIWLVLLIQHQMSDRSQTDSEESALKKLYTSCFRKRSQPKGTEQDNPIITLHITNAHSKYRLCHGPQFLPLLEPRDNVLEHDFSFKLEFSLEKHQQAINFVHSIYYDDIVRNVKKFLVEASSNVVSVAFKLLSEEKMEEKEAKEYAAKNIMLNVQAIFKQTIRALQGNQHIKARVNIDDVKEDLAIEVDCILKNIMINLADSYPQATASGGTPRMKEVINDLDRTDDQENDLIFANNLRISEYIKLQSKGQSGSKVPSEGIVFNEEGYTQFIMKVINTAIEVIQDNKGDSRERTIRQIFTQFNEKLFWLSQQKKYQPIINSLDEKKIQEDRDRERDKDRSFSISGFEDKHLTKNRIINYFDLTLERNAKKLKRLAYNQQAEEITRKEQLIKINGKKSKIFNESASSSFLNLVGEAEEGMEGMKKSKSYAIGQKIPSFVKMFSKQDFIDKSFTAKHQSILRILTKWAEYLEDIFENAEIHITRRLYPYKDFNNQIVRSFHGKNQLILRLAKQYKQVKKKFKGILKSNFTYIGTYLSKEEDAFASSVSRYTQTRKVSSKINAILTFLMVSYTSQLIHHLLRAGHQIEDGNGGKQDINLLVFRVSDLMRAKLQCSESSFINLLKTAYLLDNSPEMAGKFRLVRIKNKLDDPANNIMINYLFMGRVQCELQLSTQEPKGKAKHNYMFSHFIYQLTRGKFGTLTELAIMISQFDPMIVACKESSYSEKSQGRMLEKQAITRRPLSIEQDKMEARIINKDNDKMQSARGLMVDEAVRETFNPKKTIEEEISEAIFECVLCRKLIIKENRNIFDSQKEVNSKVCNTCIGKSINAQNLLKNRRLFQILMSQIKRGQIQRIFSYKQLQYLYKSQCIISVSDNARLDFAVVIYVQSELKHFWVKVDQRILDTIDAPNFDFKSINYIDITKDILKSLRTTRKFSRLIYSVSRNFHFLPDLYDYMNIRERALTNQLEVVIRLFKEFRQEKKMIKTIKFKAQIINANSKIDVWRVMDKIGNMLALREKGLDSKTEPLKYDKFQALDFANIKTIEAEDLNITAIPKWIKHIYNLKYVNFRNNSIQTVTSQDIPLNITELALENNNIRHIQINNHPNLAKLDLRSNALTSIDLSPLEHLTHLILSGNPLQSVDLRNLKNLAELHLENNQLKNIDVKNLQRLTRLEVANNQMQEVDLDSAVNLQRVNLSGNKFRKINLSKLPNLAQVNLKDNPITEIVLKDLPKLLKFELNNTPLVDAVLHNLAMLVELNLSSNKLQNCEFSRLESLARIDLNNNPLRNLTLSSAILLKSLRIQQTNLTNLKMENLPKLTELRLRNNQLKTIVLRTLPNLNILDVGQNKFSNFSLDHLTKLTTLLLDHNELQKISLGYETDLVHLDIRHNKLTKISLYNNQALKRRINESGKFDYAGGLGKLKTLYISGNPGLKFDAFPPSLQILQANLQAVAEVGWESMTGLKELTVWGNRVKAKNLSNLKGEVKLIWKDVE